MVRFAQERVLLIGDANREIQAALSHALPGSQITAVNSFFDGLAELSANPYTAVVASAEPIERRPEAAVRQLRELTGDGRVVLFGHPTLELLSRKMLEFGVDDYLITPASTGEIEQIFREPPNRPTFATTGAVITDASASPSSEWLGSLAVADLMLEAMLQSPHDPVGAAIKRLAPNLPAGVRLAYQPHGADSPGQAGTDETLLTHVVQLGEKEIGTLHLFAPDATIASSISAALPHLAGVFAKLASLQERHSSLHRAAITDDLTGVYNARFFRQFLARVLARARTEHFPVTLLLFDIDDFKKYNDEFGHGVGDEILKQTASLMRQCSREHDVVARIGGDEFAVVFWDKEGPRKPHDPKTTPGPFRPPQSPEQIFNRFKRMLADKKFPFLGATGQGLLGISAGMAVYPYEAQDAASLVREADNRLMHGAKKRGKNTLVIVGPEEPTSNRDGVGN